MGRYYRSKKAGKGRGWLRRNLGRAGSALKKRYMPSGKLSLAKVASDAKYALSIAKTARGLLNTEKKRYEFNTYDQVVGQVSGNTSGHFIWEITPLPSQGVGYGNRTGSSISLRSTYLRIQLRQQSANSFQGKVKFMIVATKTGENFDMTQFSQWNKYLYAVNTVAIYDMESQRDPDFFNDYKVHRQKVVKFPQDSISGNQIVKSFNFGLNFGKNGHHIRYDNNGSTPTGMRLFLVAVADAGNCSGSNSTLSSIASTTALSGYIIGFDGCHYYIDN